MNGDLTSVIRDEIFKSIHLITDSKLRTANFTSFLTSTISYVDASDPFHYKVKYQGNDIDVYSAGGQIYNLGDTVVILYSNSNFNQKKFILDSTPSSTVLKSQIYYGSFYSSLDQTISVINTEYKYTFNSINRNYGILLGNGITTGPTGSTSVMTFPNAGVYNLQYNIQLQNTDSSGAGAEHRAYIWVKKNNINLTTSLAVIDLPKARASGDSFKAFRNFSIITEVSAGDYLEIAYAYDSTLVSVWATTAGTTWPSSPSVYVNAHLVK